MATCKPVSTRAPRRGKMIQRLIRPIGMATGVLIVSAASALGAVGVGRATFFKAQFSTRHPGASSGLVLVTKGEPPVSGLTEAPAVRQTVTLPHGTALDLRALPQCNATPAALALQGAEVACPPRSRVGTGFANGLLGGKTVHFDIGIYAVRGHLVFAAERHSTPLKQYFLGSARGDALLLTVPTFAGTIIPTSFSARIAPGEGAQTWLRTPPRCPRSGQWSVTGGFQGLGSAAPGARPVTASQTIIVHAACDR